MPDPVTAAITGGVGVVSGVLGSKAESKAAGQAAGAQTQAAQLGIEEQRRQFDRIQGLLKPFVEAGTGAEGVTGALPAQQALLGLLGPEAQQAAIAELETSPTFGALARQGEEAILQAGSATGGLRGGNIQGALAQFRPQLLQQTIQGQLGNLGALTQLGQTSAVGVGAAGQSAGTNIANLLAQQGSAQAGAALASGQAKAGLFGDISGLATTGALLKSDLFKTGGLF